MGRGAEVRNGRAGDVVIRAGPTLLPMEDGSSRRWTPLACAEVTMWLSLPRLVGAVSSLPILFACASGGATGRDANLITAPELGRSRAANVYEAIRQVRPE